MFALSQHQYFEYFDCGFGRIYWFVFHAPKIQPFVSSSLDMVSPWLSRRFPFGISEACWLPASSPSAPAAPSSSSVAVGVLLASETHARSGLLSNETQRRNRAPRRPLRVFFVLFIKCWRFFFQADLLHSYHKLCLDNCLFDICFPVSQFWKISKFTHLFPIHLKHSNFVCYMNSTQNDWVRVLCARNAKAIISVFFRKAIVQHIPLAFFASLPIRRLVDVGDHTQ